MKHEVQYDCWFQRFEYKSVLPQTPDGSADRGSSQETTRLWKSLNRITTFTSTGEILSNAAKELAWGLEKMFDIKVVSEINENPVKAMPDRKDLSSTKSGIFLGLISQVNNKKGVLLPAQKPEGFVIRAEKEEIIIAGQDEAGCLYGVYRFLLLLAQGKINSRTQIAEAPVSPLRMINHWDNLDGTIERGYAGSSIFYKNNHLDYDPERIKDYARLLASVGINRISINNVNVHGAAKRLVTEEYLPEVAKLADIFRPFGIRLLLCVNFSAPYSLGDLSTADPLDPAVAAWWKRRTDFVYQYIPDLAGFLVKADSEGEPGPFQYGRSHVDGANMLAAALDFYNAIVIWRCFVYNSTQDWRDTKTDRARAAYDHFLPLDGTFAENVILQIKHGPYDFQVREPVSPLFGALKKTRHIMELQITQEYTGHQIDLCFLPYMWEWVMNFDTKYDQGLYRGSAIKEMLGRRIEGLTAVSNVGLDRNWTGHPLAQANLYGYGRLCWNPNLSAEKIVKEWSTLSFGRRKTADIVAHLLLGSYPTYEKYNAPFGVCFMVTPGLHYGCDVEGYEFSQWGTYHRANYEAIGIDRGENGTGYAAQYHMENAAIFADRKKCPENLILFFHRLHYDFKMKNGQSLLQNIYDTHFEGCDEVQKMYETWLSLEDKIDKAVFEIARQRFERQLENAHQWRDVVNTYFYRRTGIGDAKRRIIYS